MTLGHGTVAVMLCPSDCWPAESVVIGTETLVFLRGFRVGLCTGRFGEVRQFDPVCCQQRLPGGRHRQFGPEPQDVALAQMVSLIVAGKHELVLSIAECVVGIGCSEIPAAWVAFRP